MAIKLIKFYVYSNIGISTLKSAYSLFLCSLDQQHKARLILSLLSMHSLTQYAKRWHVLKMCHYDHLKIQIMLISRHCIAPAPDALDSLVSVCVWGGGVVESDTSQIRCQIF